MEIVLLSVNKVKNQNLKSLIDEYDKRIRHYIKFSHINISNIKNSKKSPLDQINSEAILIKKEIKKGDLCVLLDEKGDLLDSKKFSEFLNKTYNTNYKRIVFILGGSYGFSESIYLLNFKKISLSKMTFTHQMIKLFFCEQLYRAHTILKNEKYHH